ncbi:MAG: MCP four helix bundle domain-containing protein, partial [Alphaproteobacteria bacterium]|nr:MCP four helix bundle domain-containing protein [Alphaproteobacteria bacterium]
MSIKAKLFASLAVLSAVVCILVTAGYATLATVDAKISSIVADRVVPLSQLKLVADQYAVLIVDNAHKVRAGTFSFEEGAANMAAAEQLIAEQWAAYQATSLTPDEEILVAAANQVMAIAEPAMAQLRTILQTGNMSGLETFIADTLYPAIDPISTDVSLLVDLQVDVARAEYAGAQSLFGLMNIAMMVVTVIGATAIGLATLVIVRTVSGRLSGMEKALVAVAEGDYSVDIPSAGDRDEIGRIARAAETFRQNGLKVAAMTEAEAAQSLAVA